VEIRGHGIDIVEISRIEKMISRYGDQFLDKIFTLAEKNYCAAKGCPAVHFAGRWAAKESFYKAVSPECQQVSFWKSIEVLPVDDSLIKPVIHILTLELTEALRREAVSQILLSISHEKSHCIASVIIA
jgi:holo-[acyl-carrier protein] synthase